MKKEQLYESIGDISENYINDAHRTVKKWARPNFVKWSAVAACLCLVIAAAVAFYPIQGPQDVEGPYSYAIAYAGWCDMRAIGDGALNRDLLQNEENEHLPVFRADTLEELEEFKTRYKDVFVMDQGYGNVRSFCAVLEQAQFDREIFYENNSLLLVYVPANSGSLRFSVDEIVINDNSLCFFIAQEDNQEVVSDDMAGWMLLVKAAKDEIRDYTSFDAVLDEKSDESNRGRMLKIAVPSIMLASALLIGGFLIFDRKKKRNFKR